MVGKEICDHGPKCELSEDNWLQVECPICKGYGCSDCDDGYFKLTECARKYVSEEIWSGLKYASVAEHHLPKAGGTADQSAWFLDLWITYTNEKSKLEIERLEKASNGI